MYKPLFCAAAIAAGAAVAFIAGRQPSAATPMTVVIKDYEFSPAMLTVAPGTTVTWVNEDESPHTIAAEGKIFRSAALDTSDRFSYTFTEAGEFTYFCTLHPMMVGKVLVKPAGSSS